MDFRYTLSPQTVFLFVQTSELPPPPNGFSYVTYNGNYVVVNDLYVLAQE